MLIAIFIWLYIFIVIYLYGLITIDGLRRVFHIEADQKIKLPLLLLLGLVTVTVITMLANLFIPLEAIFMLLLSAGALIIFVQRRHLPSVAFPKFTLGT